MEKALDSGSSKIKDTNSSKNKSEMLMKCGVNWEYPCGFVWPPRYYKCSFCRREFKSAQALGGHMNVHRTERAKLRDHSSSSSSTCPNSWVSSRAKHETPFSNPNPNPANPTNPSSLPPSSIYTHQYTMVSLSLSCLSSSPPPSANPIMASTCPSSFKGSLSSAIDPDHHEEEDDQDKVVKLDLELGQFRETKDDHDHDLDLELTLGSRRSY